MSNNVDLIKMKWKFSLKQKVSTLRPYKYLLSLAAICLYSGNAFSSCEIASGATQMRWLINVGTITVQRDAPVGSIIYSRDLTSVNQGRTLLSCTGTTETQYYNMLMGTAVPGFTDVYSTNLPGVGIKVTSTNGNPFRSPFNQWIFNSPFTLAGPYKFYLIKTGPITSGALTTGRQFTWTTTQTSGGTLTVAYGDITGGSVNSVACSVTNTSINVPMGDIPRRQFTGVGSWVGASQFFIPLNCDANTRVNFTIDATADSSGLPGMVALDAPGSGTGATGLGIQLTHSGTPVVFGTPILGAVTANAGGVFIPLAARYYQTASSVTAGQANASATFTMTYN